MTAWSNDVALYSAELVKEAVEQGHADAQSRLGFCYWSGIGVGKDESEAVKWFKKAAEQGDVKAQYSLGYCYLTGAGVGKDEKEAVKWYTKAAEQGFEIAKKCLQALPSKTK